MHVSLRSQSDAETFALGLKSFVNEAKLLARFDHPSLLKVLRFWEANGTAYMAMPVMRGRTLKDVRADMHAAPDETWLRAMLIPLLGAIETLHGQGVYHRDIAPDNIQIEPDGHPVLLDFGAARRVISDKSQTLTAILKPAYAPIEQYGEAGSVKQGPWTDLYALGATLHYLLLGRPPAPATARAVHDDVSALSVESCPGSCEDFLRTIDWMLAPRPHDRPQSVAQLREVLEGRMAPPLRRVVEPVPVSQWDRTVVQRPTGMTSPPGVDADATLVMPRATLPPVRPAVPDTVAVPRAAAAPVPAAEARGGGSKLLPIGLAAALLVAAGAGYTVWSRSSGPTAAVPSPAASVAAASTPASAAVSVPESKVTTVVVPPAAAPAPAPTVAAPTLAAPMVAAPAAPVASTPRTATALPARDKPATAAATRPATTSPSSPTVASTQPTPSAAAPAALSPPVQAQAEPAPVKPATPASEAARAAVLGPEASCAGRSFLSHIGCMEKACLKSEFTSHPDCLAWRKNAKRE
jgi:non-specific serine/threonine protein kinase